MDEHCLVFTGWRHDLRPHRLFRIRHHAKRFRHSMVSDDDVFLWHDRLSHSSDYYRAIGVRNNSCEGRRSEKDSTVT